jgi:RNA polymerase sigma-70 factor (ECF subfamily)
VHLSDDKTVQTQAKETPGAAEFATFMRTYQNMVYSTSLRLSNDAAQAEDVSQEVFLRAHSHWGELRDNPRAAGWLKTVSRNLTLTHLTRYRKRWVFFSQLGAGEPEEDDHEVDFADGDSRSVAGEAVDAERRRLVEAALARLPEHQRVPLVLFHFEELPYEEIAAQLRISLPKLKTDMHRARLALGKRLAAQGITVDELHEEEAR